MHQFGRHYENDSKESAQKLELKSVRHSVVGWTDDDAATMHRVEKASLWLCFLCCGNVVFERFCTITKWNHASTKVLNFLQHYWLSSLIYFWRMFKWDIARWHLKEVMLLEKILYVYFRKTFLNKGSFASNHSMFYTLTSESLFNSVAFL